MKSLRWRLTLWFAVSVVAVLVVMMLAAHWHLDYELRLEKFERTHPAHPDWVLHGSFTDQEVHDILGELVEFWLMLAVPVVALALLAADTIARRSTRPVQQINGQLNRLGIRNLKEPVLAPDADPEIGELVRHLNDLLGRLQTSFVHLREYTGDVAHELRTPLQLMRLRVEGNAASMNPEFAEELQEELARLSNYVEAALTLAHAEQGRLELNLQPVPLRPFLTDLLEPFARLAEVDGRRLLWSCAEGATAWADRDILKQVLFNLLNNALKHGAGDVHLQVRARARGVTLLIGNQVAPKPPRTVAGLGIGLRLVTALMQQLPGGRVDFRRGRYFWVRLAIPVRAMTQGSECSMPSAANGHADAGSVRSERREGSAACSRGDASDGRM
jgi:signal transduction histidine kinase